MQHACGLTDLYTQLSDKYNYVVEEVLFGDSKCSQH